jgi:hypothetical protein
LRYGIDFEFDSIPKNWLYGGSCRPNSRKEFRIDAIKGIEIAKISQMARTLHSILKTETGRLKDFSGL